MDKNPYNYLGALDLVQNELVCAPRKDDVEKVVDKIIWGDYWAILGPRQIGKTTFLRQVEKGLIERKESKNYYTLYFDLGVIPQTNEGFYEWLKERLHEEVPSESIKNIDDRYRKYGPEFQFLNFLLNFKPKNDKEKIVLLFDEIEGVPSIRDFLRVWRKVYHERCNKNRLYRYSVVITGSADLIALTEGTTSPFNIAKILYLKELSEAEGRRLIDEPLHQNNIEIKSAAKKALLSLTSCHPQLLQHSCSLLAEIANKQKRSITKEDIDTVVRILFKESQNLDLLRNDLEFDTLKTLIDRILKGDKVRFHPYKTFSIEGAGSIIENDMGFCAIRNELYKRFAVDFYASKGIPDIKMPKIFILSGPKNGDWSQSLFLALKDFECQVFQFSWKDEKMQGAQWYSEMKKNLKDTRMAILLVSDDLLDTEYIDRKKIKPILEERYNNDMIIFPILVDIDARENRQLLEGILPQANEKKYRLQGSPTYQEEKCDEIVNEIVGILNLKQKEEKY